MTTETKPGREVPPSQGVDAARGGAFHEDAADQGVPLQSAVAWVEANQTLAMLGAFALGVFVGVLMRR